jgi:hypothetical protein
MDLPRSCVVDRVKRHKFHSFTFWLGHVTIEKFPHVAATATASPVYVGLAFLNGRKGRARIEPGGYERLPGEIG